jgi:putative ABC transport system permease protein
MRRVAIKGLTQRRMRSILTALAVVLGVAMVSGTFVLTDTINKAFNDIFSGAYKNTSAIISGRQIVKGSASGNATVPQSLLTRVRRLPDVQAAAGALADLSSNADTAKLIDRQGKAISKGGAPTFGFGIDTTQPRFNPLHLVQGRWASGSGQVVIDAGTARDHHYAVGDRIGVSAVGPVRRFTITGIAKYENVDSLGGATIAIFDIPTAQALLGKQGQLDSILLAARPEVSQERLVREVRPLLRATATVQTAAERAAANAKETKNFLAFLQYALLAFGAIALFVGSFVIFNTLSITVAQRAREFATLRTLGASRRQVLRSVLLESLVLGLAASIAGLLLGLVLAKGLSALFKALSLDLPQGSSVFAGRTVIVSILVGVSITMLASLAPALRATRVPPIAAVREGAELPPSRLSRHSASLAIGLTAAALAGLLLGSFASGLPTGIVLLLIGVGSLALFVGIGLVAPRLVRPLAAVLGEPARRVGGTAGRLAQRNSTRNPARTAATAAALMIGLALVTLVATLGQGLRSSDRKALENQIRADYVVTSQNGFQQFSAQAGKALPSTPGIGTASAIFEDRARVFGSDTRVDGVDPATLAQAYRFQWKRGSDAVLATLGAGGAVVKKSFADKHHLSVGSSFAITSPSGRHLVLRVRGISDPPVFDKIDPILGEVTISQQAFAAAFPRPQILLVLLKIKGGASPAITSSLERALAPFPDAKIQTKSEWVQTRSAGINKLLNLLYVLLALSVVVSLFGMVNTLVLAVFERTRELGMLRAVGMTRQQVRRMIRHESVITALIGAALGLPLGVFLAALITHALSNQGLAFALPVALLIVFTLVAVLAGLSAAVFPARRAAGLNVLGALQYE